MSERPHSGGRVGPASRLSLTSISPAETNQPTQGQPAQAANEFQKDGARRDACPTRFSAFAPLLVAFLAAFLFLPARAATNAAVPTRSVGIEGHVAVDLPKGDYRPRPLDDRTEVILRVENITPSTNGASRYDFHYIGFEPGHYNLADYLIRPDGSRPDEVGDVRIQVRALLPENHDGQLQPYAPRLFPWIGGYRMFLGLLAVLWAGGFVAFVMVGRRKKAIVAPVVAPPVPSLADRLRPLVEAAAAGKLTVDGQAQLERLLLGYWRARLQLPDQRMADALAHLKQHAEAGALVHALERWLHRPGGAAPQEVAALLEPYRRVAAPATTEGGAA
jgi:hypothetical protein